MREQTYSFVLILDCILIHINHVTDLSMLLNIEMYLLKNIIIFHNRCIKKKERERENKRPSRDLK